VRRRPSKAQTASVSRIVSRTKPKTIKQNAKRLLSRDYDLNAKERAMIHIYHCGEITYTTAASERQCERHGLIDGCGIAIRMLSEQELSKMMGTPVPQEPATMDRKRLNWRSMRVRTFGHKPRGHRVAAPEPAPMPPPAPNGRHRRCPRSEILNF
jgi:hypothetical protein